MTVADIYAYTQGVILTASAVTLALTRRPRHRYLLALLKGALVSFTAVALLFVTLLHGGVDSRGVALLSLPKVLAIGAVAGAIWGLPGGMFLGVELLSLRRRREGRRSAAQAQEQ